MPMAQGFLSDSSHVSRLTPLEMPTVRFLPVADAAMSDADPAHRPLPSLSKTPIRSAFRRTTQPDRSAGVAQG